MRKYEPIWKTIKADRSAQISCAPSVRARIKKAVIKEKDMDTEYKELYCSRLSIKVLPDGLFFSLYEREFKDGANT